MIPPYFYIIHGIHFKFCWLYLQNASLIKPVLRNFIAETLDNTILSHLNYFSGPLVLISHVYPPTL